MKGCYRHARLLENGEAGAQRLPLALPFYERACNAGVAVSCVNLSAIQGNAESEDIDWARWHEWSRQACELGHPLGCYNQANAVLHRVLTGSIADPTERLMAIQKAKALYGQSCDGGHAQGCLRRSELHRGFTSRVVYTPLPLRRQTQIPGAPQEPSEALSWARRGCERGDWDSCVDLLHLESRSGRPPRARGAFVRMDREAFRTATQSCFGGDIVSCARVEALPLARLHASYGIDARPVSLPDTIKGTDQERLLKACLVEGDAIVCYAVGHYLVRGLKGFVRNLGGGASTLRSGCEHGVETACAELAVLYRRGGRVRRDLGQAVALFEKACEGGDAASCHELAFMYRRGLGVAPDAARADGLERRACAEGFRPGCP
jgi:TPR repeat protein